MQFTDFILAFCVNLLDFRMRTLQRCANPKKSKLMKISPAVSLSVLLLASSSSTIQAQVQLIWACGLDDNGWPAGDGGGPNASFVQETGSINPLPGNPASPEG